MKNFGFFIQRLKLKLSKKKSNALNEYNVDT